MVSKILLLICISIVLYTILLALPLQISKLKRAVITIVSSFSSALLLYTHDILLLWQSIAILFVANLLISYFLAKNNNVDSESTYTISGLTSKKLIIQVNKNDELPLGEVNSEKQSDNNNNEILEQMEMEEYNSSEIHSSEEIDEQSGAIVSDQDYILNNIETSGSLIDEEANRIKAYDSIEDAYDYLEEAHVPKENLELDQNSERDDKEIDANDFNYEELYDNDLANSQDRIEVAAEENLLEQESAQKDEEYDLSDKVEHYNKDELETIDELTDLSNIKVDEIADETETEINQLDEPAHLSSTNMENPNENSSILDLFNDENVVVAEELETKNIIQDESTKEQNVEIIEEPEYPAFNEDELLPDNLSEELFSDLDLNPEIVKEELDKDENTDELEDSKEEEVAPLNFTLMETNDQFINENHDNENKQIGEVDDALINFEELQSINSLSNEANEEEQQVELEEKDEKASNESNEEDHFDFDLIEEEMKEDQQNLSEPFMLKNITLDEKYEDDINDYDFLEDEDYIENTDQDEKNNSLNIDLVSHFRNDEVEDDLLFKGINSLHNKNSASIAELISELNNHDEEMSKEEQLKEKRNNSKNEINNDVFLAPLEDDEEDIEEERKLSQYVRSYTSYDGPLARLTRSAKYKKKKWWKAWK